MPSCLTSGGGSMNTSLSKTSPCKKADFMSVLSMGHCSAALIDKKQRNAFLLTVGESVCTLSFSSNLGN